jgi:hypothetical protein
MGAAASSPSPAGFYSDTCSNLLSPGKLTGESFGRNTNVIGYYRQTAGNCYAYAACSAYLNTVARIYKPITALPTFGECMETADYNNGNGGSVAESIRRLENKYRFGVLCKNSKNGQHCSIRDVMMTSIGFFHF